MKSTLTFALHQFIGMFGIPETAPLVFSLAFKFPFLSGHNSSQRRFYSLVSESPYFPVQIIFALLLGWLPGRTMRHRSMTWVWVLPLLILVYSLVTARVLNPTSVFAMPGVVQSRFSHYFGSGCRPAERCLDQLVITMPFYSSLAYSLGAVLARKTFVRACPQNKRDLQAATAAGLVVLAACVIDLVISVRQSGWHSIYLPLMLTPVGLGALLVYVGSIFRRQPVASV